MPDNVVNTLEETIPLLHRIRREKLLSPDEISKLTSQRRDHEYALLNNPSPETYLEYVALERALCIQLHKRSRKRPIKQSKAASLINKSSTRVNLIYSRAVKHYKGNEQLWLHYARHCIRERSFKAARKVLASAIAVIGSTSSEVWTTAIAMHFDTLDDVNGARGMSRRGLRAMPQSSEIWMAYLRMELSYLSKTLAKRYSIGVNVEDGPLPSTNNAKQQNKKHIRFDNTEAGESAADATEKPESEAKEVTMTEEDTEIESLGENDESMRRRKSQKEGKLSFWQGGIPNTVFRNACEATNFSEKHLADLWAICNSSPCLPACLLSAIATHMSEKYPQMYTPALLSIQSQWFCSCASYFRNLAKHTLFGNQHMDKAVVDEMETEKGKLLEDALKVLTESEKWISEKDLTPSGNEQVASIKMALNVVLDCFADLLKKVSPKDTRFQELIDNMHSAIAKKVVVEKQQGSTEEDAASRSYNHLYDKLAKSNEMLSGNTERKLHSSVLRKAVVPFRNTLQEKIICMLLGRLTRNDLLQQLVDALEQSPPLTAPVIMALIDAHMRIATLDTPEPDENCKETVRQLYRTGSSLPQLQREIEFWLRYMQFERVVMKDSNESTSVHDIASRHLGEAKQESFKELLLLRSMTGQ